MKSVLRMYLSCLAGLYIGQYLVNSFKLGGGLENLLFASGVLTIIYLFVRPLLKILFLPINLLSLGFLSWIINVAVLYILKLIIPQIEISSWKFQGFSYQGLIIPSYYFNEVLTFIIVSFILSFVINFFSWLSK